MTSIYNYYILSVIYIVVCMTSQIYNTQGINNVFYGCEKNGCEENFNYVSCTFLVPITTTEYCLFYFTYGMLQ